MTTLTDVSTWVEKYVHAWTLTSHADLTDALDGLFTPTAESHEWPYETHWVGLTQIVDGWLSRVPWQQGGWDFEWRLLAINGDTFVIRGLGRYAELGTFDNLWVVTLDETMRLSTTFRMWNNQVDTHTQLDENPDHTGCTAITHLNNGATT